MRDTDKTIGNLAEVFLQSNLSTQAICVVLFAGSILAWTLMITKIRDLSAAARDSEQFIAAYRKESHPVSLHLKRQRYDCSPVFAIYDKSCKALGAELQAQGADPADLFMGGIGEKSRKLGEMQVCRLRNMAQRTMADQSLLLDDRMTFLSTAVVAAPLMGLLGTLWGLMETFRNLDRNGTASLANIAPGISAALLPAVIGLLVAMPSLIGYCVIASRTRLLRGAMANIAQELMSDVEGHFLQEK